MTHSIPPRLVIYVKDVENITGKKNRTARRMYLNIKKQAGKPEPELLTVQDFCKVTGIPEEVVRLYLVN
jgi:hypothetical protein